MLELTKDEFKKLFENHTSLRNTVIDWYSKYVNKFLFETVHNEFNPNHIKIANLIYLLAMNISNFSNLVIGITQEELGEILGLSRVHITRGLSELRKVGVITTSRNKINITNLELLKRLCSYEALL